MVVYDANFDHNLKYKRRRGGGEVITDKEGGSLTFLHRPESRGAFPPPPPLFINNDQSLIEDVDKMQWLVNYEKWSCGLSLLLVVA